jgi:hypothetical protein
MFGPDDILWGNPPGQGPELRNMVERETGRANHSWPGLWFFGIILLLFFILIPIFLAWDFISPRSFREFTYGPHPISIPAKDLHPHPIRWANAQVSQNVPARKIRRPSQGD